MLVEFVGQVCITSLINMNLKQYILFPVCMQRDSIEEE